MGWICPRGGGGCCCSPARLREHGKQPAAAHARVSRARSRKHDKQRVATAGGGLASRSRGPWLSASGRGLPGARVWP